MFRTLLASLPLAIALGACIVTPRGAPVPLEGLADGSYEGQAVSFPNSAKVRVNIEGGRLTEVEVLTHKASGIGHRVDEVLPGLIVEQQSTAVDAVSGATNSSNVIMEAAQKALEQASEEP